MAVIYLKIKDQIISDLPYWSANGPDVGYITDKSAAIASAYDYYPFGMLMPDRYVSDTSSQCMTVTQTRWVTTWVDSCYDVPLFDGIHLSDLTVFYLNGATATADSGLLVFDAQRIDASISLEGLSVIPNAAQSITFDIDEVKSGSARIEVSEIAGGQRVILGSALADSRSLTEIDFVPGGNNVTVDLVGPFERLAVRTICVKRPVPVEQTYLVDVCSGLKDRYRFGFNGQEKVNEWAGIGNHNTAEFWEYDTRTGRRLERDPVTKVWASDYAAFSGNPIIFIDPNGNTDFFNRKGELIGTDNIPNGVKIWVLKKTTEREVEKQMLEKKSVALDEKQLKNTHLVPSEETLNQFKSIFEIPAIMDNANEYGLWAGLNIVDVQVSTPIIEGKDGDSGSKLSVPSFPRSKAMEAFFKIGGTKGYGVHYHPNAIKYSGNNQYTGEAEFKTADENASPPDRQLSGYKNAFADVVLKSRPKDKNAPTDEDKKRAKEANGGWILRTDTDSQEIEIYNPDGTLYRGTLEDYEKMMKKINSTPSKK